MRYAIMTVMAGAMMAAGCGGAGGSLGGNNVSKQFNIELSLLRPGDDLGEVPVDLDGDGQADAVIRGSIILWFADYIEQHDSGLLAGAEVKPLGLPNITSASAATEVPAEDGATPPEQASPRTETPAEE